MVPVGKSDCDNSSTYLTQTIEPLLIFAVFQVNQDQTLGVCECKLGNDKGYAVFDLIQAILVVIPFKPGHFHIGKIPGGLKCAI